MNWIQRAIARRILKGKLDDLGETKMGQWLMENKGLVGMILAAIYGGLYVGGPADATWDDSAMRFLEIAIAAGVSAGFVPSDTEQKIKNLRKQSGGKSRRDDPR